MTAGNGFGGRIGRTLADSEPWWPTPPEGGRPNIVMVVLDDTGFAHFGCYGSNLATPSIDGLAAKGLRYNNFHTTALCSPTRACLLTGRNHHTVGMRGLSNWDSGFPNMRGEITPDAATIAQLLRTAGYATYAAGKWHLAPMQECSAAGPHHNWPLQKGFDRYYGFLQGETDQFSPELTHDNHHVDPPATPADGYHVSEDLVDRSMGWIRDLVSVRPDRPFFLYLAFGAMHAPHQAPAAYRERWRGRFDAGYEAVREEWYARQLELGVIPAGTTLAPRNPGVPPWEELPENHQRFANRLQEAFAAMLEHTDDQIGRLTSFLDELGLLDDTLLMVLSDNGASQEGGPHGVMDEWSWFNQMPEDIDALVAAGRLDDIGGPHSHSNYPWGWAQAGNSPLRWYKQNTYGGGVRDPLVVHWPAKVTAEQAGAVRPQFCHAIDVAATVLDAAGVTAPETFAGRDQLPVDGRSLIGTFTDADAPAPRSVQYFEQMGHRGIWVDGWKATTYHRAGTPFDEDEWGLYDLRADFSECHDLGPDQPEKLAEMVGAWWAEAEDKGVLPLDDRTIELFLLPPRPGTPHARRRYDYLPPMSHLPADAAPRVGGRHFELTVELTVDDDVPAATGVLYARGSHNVGHCFFARDGRLVFDYNSLGDHTRAEASVDIGPGHHTVTASFTRDDGGPGATIAVGLDGQELATAHVPRAVLILGSTGVDIGRGPLTAVVDDVEGPSPFTATIHRVTFDVGAPHPAADLAAAHAEAATE
jgi:arylsulfatase